MRGHFIVISVVFALLGCERDPLVVNLDDDAGLDEPGESVSEAVAQCRAETNCPLCTECASDGPCYTHRIGCSETPDCVDLLNCHSGCTLDDTACINDCSAQFPGGRAPLETWLNCVICDVCDPRCDNSSCE